MKYRFLGCPAEFPRADGVKKLCRLSRDAIYKIDERLGIYEKFAFPVLQKLRVIVKIKGSNPNKLHELRIKLPEGSFRLFFIMLDNENALILHITSKKKQRIDNDIELAKKRAKNQI